MTRPSADSYLPDVELIPALRSALDEVARLREALDDCDRIFYGWSWVNVASRVERLHLHVRAALSTGGHQ